MDCLQYDSVNIKQKAQLSLRVLRASTHKLCFTAGDLLVFVFFPLLSFFLVYSSLMSYSLIDIGVQMCFLKI